MCAHRHSTGLRSGAYPGSRTTVSRSHTTISGAPGPRGDAAPAPGAALGRPTGHARFVLEADERVLVAFGGGPGRHLHAAAHPVQQPGGPGDAVGDVGLPPDRCAHSGGGPHLVVRPAMRGRPLIEAHRELGLPAGAEPAAVAGGAFGTRAIASARPPRPALFPAPCAARRSAHRHRGEVGRRRGARGSGPFPTAPSRTARASFPARRSPVIMPGQGLWAVPHGLSRGNDGRPPASCDAAWP
jgi:hypothetical protein